MSRALVLPVLTLLACGPKDAPVQAAADVFGAMPQPAAPAPWAPEAPATFTLDNGITVYFVEDHALPLLSLRIVVPTGSADDPTDGWGLAAIGASMLMESAGGRTTLEQSAAFDRLATDFHVSAGADALVVSLDTRAGRLQDALPLAADALLRPGFDEADWTRVKSQTLTGLQAAFDDNASVASIVSKRLFYGAEHPYGHPTDGLPSTVEALTLDQVKTWHRSQVHAGGASIVVVGDIDQEALAATLAEHLGGWTAKERPPVVETPPNQQQGYFFVDMPGTTQTMFTIAKPGPIGSAPDQAPLDAVGVVLGGSFTSRLNNRLREQLGLTYGAGLGVNRARRTGRIVASSKIRGDATAQALQEFEQILTAAAKDGFSADELGKAKGQLVTDVVSSAQTRASLAGLFASELARGASPDGVKAYADSIALLTVERLAEAAPAVSPEGATILLVGDKQAVMPSLEAAGYTTWTLLDLEGKAVE